MGEILDMLSRQDEKLFLFLNGLHTPKFDILMTWITARNTWIPLYVLLILLIWRSFEWKKALIFIVYLLLAVGFADFLSSGLMKPFFERPRPCYSAELQGLIHLIGNCGGKFGFISSHAANSFALFGGIYMIFKKKSLVANLLPVWAILVSYSRIYVGVHYPADILIGALVGFCLSFALYIFVKYVLKKLKIE